MKPAKVRSDSSEQRASCAPKQEENNEAYRDGSLTEASGNNRPSRAEMARTLDYDPKTGAFRRFFPRGWVPTGFFNGGYVQLRFGRKTFYAHQVAWLFMTGEWPLHEIDHRDRNRSNNRWSNLRPATRHGQMGNQSLRKDNTSGIKGVSMCNGKWSASIWQNGKPKHLGVFDTKEEAATAYRTAAIEIFGEFAHPARRDQENGSSVEYRMLERGEPFMVGDEFLMRGEWKAVLQAGGRKCGWIYPTVRRPIAKEPVEAVYKKRGEATYRVPVRLFPPLPIDRTGEASA